jgi:hypothetical protein
LDLGWAKELLLVMLWKVLLDNPRLSKIGPLAVTLTENRVEAVHGKKRSTKTPTTLSR